MLVVFNSINYRLYFNGKGLDGIIIVMTGLIPTPAGSSEPPVTSERRYLTTSTIYLFHLFHLFHLLLPSISWRHHISTR